MVLGTKRGRGWARLGAACLALSGVAGCGRGALADASDAGSTSDAARCQPACVQGQVCGTDGLCLGEVVWSFPVSYAETALDLALAADGTVVVPSRDPDLTTADLQGLSPDGQLLWTTNISTIDPGDSVVQLSNPIAAPTGAIYVGQMNTLTAVRATGQPLFATEIPATVSRLSAMAPAVAPDGTAYFQYLTTIGPDGTLLWSQPTGYLGTTGNANTVVLRPDRILSVGGSQADSDLFYTNLYDQNGAIVWTQPTGDLSDTIAVTSNDAFVRGACPDASAAGDPDVVSASCGEIRSFAIDTGNELWSAPSPDPGLDARDILVLADGTLLALGETWALATNPSTHSFLWRLSPSGAPLGSPVEIPYDAVRSSVLGDDGVLYLSMFDARPDGRGGILAVDPVSGEVKWSYTTTGPAGATAPTIAANGCLLTMIVDLDGSGSAKAVCLRSSSRGIAATPWPMTLGHNRATPGP